MADKTLFVSDLDGTLLDADARLSAESVRLLNLAISNGALFTIATARTPATVEPIFAQVRTNLPMIVMTGAAVWHRDTLSYSNLHFIPADRVAPIDAAFASNHIHPFVYTLPPTGVLTAYHGAPVLNAIDAEFVEQRRHTHKRFFLATQAPAETAATRLLYFAMGAPYRIFAIAETLKRTGCAISAYFDTYHDNTAIIEVFAPGVSKANAVARMKTAIQATRLTVFGDNLNDLPMMEIADTAVAVANARPAVLDVANIRIAPNTASSVARFIAENSKNTLN